MASRAWWLAGVFALAQAAWAAPGLGVVSVLDGPATVWRGEQRFAAAEGLRVLPEDVLASTDATRLVRVELDDGRVLDLGPATQAMLQPAGPLRGATAWLAAGWAKLAAPAAVPASLASPRLAVQQVTGSTLLFAGPGDASWLHVESGRAEARVRDGAQQGAPVPLADAQVLTLRGATGADVADRLAPAQRAQLPRSFVDAVPRRAARLAAHEVEPPAGTPVSYDDAAPWINGDAALRGAFVGRLSARIKDPAFRRAVLADMRLHPEWQRLFPPPAPPRAVARPVPKPAPHLPILPPPPDDEPVSASDLRAAAH